MLARTFIAIIITGLSPIYAMSSDPNDPPCVGMMKNHEGGRRPTLETLPPDTHSAEETYYYTVRLPGSPTISMEQYYKIQERIDRFLTDRQMHHFHATTAISSDRDSFVMWSSPEVATMIRDFFADSNWIWTGDFKKVKQPIRPEILTVLEYRKKLLNNLLEEFSQILDNQKSGALDPNTFVQLYQKANAEYNHNGLPEGTNLAHFNRTENSELTYSARRFHAMEFIADSIKGLSEAGLLGLSVKSSQYYAALRILPGLSDRIKSQPLRDDISSAMSQAKAMNEDEVALRVRSETIGGVLSTIQEAIYRSEGDPRIEELGYRLINRLIEKTHLSKLMQDPHAAQSFSNMIMGGLFNRHKDGIVGHVQRPGPERFKYLQWVLKNNKVDERARIVAQNLLKRAYKNGQYPEGIVLSKDEFEEVYLSFAMRVSTVPGRGLYKHGFFIDETYQMRSEVSEYLVIADGEANELGIPLVHWTNPEDSSRRLSELYLRRAK